jgi:hypothetical protein
VNGEVGVEDVSSTPQPTGSVEQNKERLKVAQMFQELMSRDRETGNPLAGLSGAERARI